MTTQPSKVYANSDYSAVIDANGYVYTFGRNKYGNLGIESNSGMNVHEPTQITITNNESVQFSDLSLSGQFMLGLTQQGEVYVWGDTSYLELNHDSISGDDQNNRFARVNTMSSKISGSEPHKIELSDKVVSLASGEKHIVLVMENGDVYTSGSNYNKQLGINSNQKSSGLTRINAKNIVKAAAGQYHTLLLDKDGKVYSFGKNAYGQSGIGKNQTDVLQPTQIKVNQTFKDIYCGENKTFLVDVNNKLWVAGENKEGCLGLNTTQNVFLFNMINDVNNIVKVGGGGGHSVLLKQDNSTNEMLLCGRNDNGQLGLKNVRGQVQSVAAKRLEWFKYDSDIIDKCVITDVAAGTNHTLFIAQCE